MADYGILLLKYWLEVSPDEQTRRLESRIHDPRKIWKLSDMDLKSYSRWYDYSRATGRDVRRHRHRVGALVCRRHRRQEARLGSTSSATCSAEIPHCRPFTPQDRACPGGSGARQRYVGHLSWPCGTIPAPFGLRASSRSA